MKNKLSQKILKGAEIEGNIAKKIMELKRIK